MYRCVKTVLLLVLLMAPASLVGGLTFHGHHDPEVLLQAIGDPMMGVNGFLGTRLPTGGTGLVFLGVNLLLLWTFVLVLSLLYSWRRPQVLRQKVHELEERNREREQFIDELSAKCEMAWSQKVLSPKRGALPQF